MKNIMSVDLEDYFCDLPFPMWENYQERVIFNTNKILKLFKKYNVKATFFTLGYIAEKFPNLIQQIDEKGHEIGSHSYSHIDLRKHTKENIEKDLIKYLMHMLKPYLMNSKILTLILRRKIYRPEFVETYLWRPPINSTGLY